MPRQNCAVAIQGQALLSLSLPPSDSVVMRGVLWGRPEELFSPAFWRTQVWYRELAGTVEDFRIGGTLAEEIAACLLGGYGMPAEVALGAFRRLQAYGLLSGPPWAESSVFVEALAEPLTIQHKMHCYRFPRQRGTRLANALRALEESPPPSDNPTAFRAVLLNYPGIGYKTASWIARNHLGVDCFAILDVHVMRAGSLLGLWKAQGQPGRHYLCLENTFVQFAMAIGTAASTLDAVMWTVMREFGRVAHDALPSTC